MLVLVLLAVPLGGCLGDADPDGEDDPTVFKTRAEVQAGSSGIEGVVTDTAVQPIVGAEVAVVELDRTSTTASDGSYAIAPVPPGTYTLTVAAPGFVPASERVEAREDRVATVDFLLTPLQSDLPFVEQFEIGGFMDYGWGLGANATGNATWVRDTNCDYDAIANTRCRGEFELSPPLETLVFEMTWRARGPLAEKMMAMMRVSDNASIITGTWAFFRVEGPSPLHMRMDRAGLDAVLERFRANCENGDEQFCGLSFRDEGWPLQTRVWPGWQCPTDAAGFCAVVQQDYTQFVTGFFNAPGPPGFSVVEGDEVPGGKAASRAGPGPWTAHPTAVDQPPWGAAGAGSAAPQPTSRPPALPVA